MVDGQSPSRGRSAPAGRPCTSLPAGASRSRGSRAWIGVHEGDHAVAHGIDLVEDRVGHGGGDDLIGRASPGFLRTSSLQDGRSRLDHAVADREGQAFSRQRWRGSAREAARLPRIGRLRTGPGPRGTRTGKPAPARGAGRGRPGESRYARSGASSGGLPPGCRARVPESSRSPFGRGIDLAPDDLHGRDGLEDDLRDAISRRNSTASGPQFIRMTFTSPR